MVASAFDFSSLPSFLSYGIPGLVLGLIAATLFGAASMKVTEDRLKAIKLVLQYGLAFVFIATVAVLIPLFVNPTVVLHVQVDPDQKPNDPQARAIITSDLSPLPNSAGTIIVQQSHGHDFIKVDITRLVYEVALEKQSIAALHEQLDSANAQLAASGSAPGKKDVIIVADAGDAPLPDSTANSAASGKNTSKPQTNSSTSNTGKSH
jgi:hypothetical protein